MSSQPSSADRPVEDLYNWLIAYEQARRKATPKPERSVALTSSQVFIVSFALALIFVWLGRRAPLDSVKYYALLILTELSLLIAVVSAVVWAPAGMVEVALEFPGILRSFKDPLQHLLNVNAALDEDYFQVIGQLRDRYDLGTLNFVAKQLSSRKIQLLDRYGLIIGSPSQLKILLIFVGVFQVGLAPSFRPLLFRNASVVVGFGLFFLLFVVMAIGDQIASQRIEELVQLVELAADGKKTEMDRVEKPGLL